MKWGKPCFTYQQFAGWAFLCMTKVTVAEVDLHTQFAWLIGEIDMCKLTVVDLQRQEALSPSEMSQVAGGLTADCDSRIQVWANCHDTADALASMGFVDAAVALQEGGNAVLGHCPL